MSSVGETSSSTLVGSGGAATAAATAAAAAAAAAAATTSSDGAGGGGGGGGGGNGSTGGDTLLLLLLETAMAARAALGAVATAARSSRVQADWADIDSDMELTLWDIDMERGRDWDIEQELRDDPGLRFEVGCEGTGKESGVTELLTGDGVRETEGTWGGECSFPVEGAREDMADVGAWSLLLAVDIGRLI